MTVPEPEPEPEPGHSEPVASATPSPARDDMAELRAATRELIDGIEGLTVRVDDVDRVARTIAAGAQHELDQLRAQLADVAARLAKLEPEPPPPQRATDKALPPPRAWVDRAVRKDWDELAAWVGWLTATYDVVPSRAVPPCWPAHRGVVEELAALHAAWREAAIRAGGQKPTDALIFWHERWLHPFLERMHEAFQTRSCTDRHTPARPGRVTDPELLAEVLVTVPERAPDDETTPSEMAGTTTERTEEGTVDPATGELDDPPSPPKPTSDGG